MSVTHPSPKPPTPVPVAAQPNGRESIAATWCRQIADAVAEALGTTFTDATYLLTLREDLPAPHRLQVAFRTGGHRVDIVVRWPDLWQAPRFELRVDGHDTAAPDDPTQRPAVTLAHAALRAILDAAHPATEDPVAAGTVR